MELCDNCGEIMPQDYDDTVCLYCWHDSNDDKNDWFDEWDRDEHGAK